MLALSRKLNPGVEHHLGDMRTVRIPGEFDAVLAHDAISYMLSEDDLRAVLATARVHLRPGGVFLAAPDLVLGHFPPAGPALAWQTPFKAGCADGYGRGTPQGPGSCRHRHRVLVRLHNRRERRNACGRRPPPKRAISDSNVDAAPGGGGVRPGSDAPFPATATVAVRLCSAAYCEAPA